MSIEYWVTCMQDPWGALADDDVFGEIVSSLRGSQGIVTVSSRRTVLA